MNCAAVGLRVIARYDTLDNPPQDFLLDLGYAVTAQENGLRESASGKVPVDRESAVARSAAVVRQADIAPAKSVQTIRGDDDFLQPVAFLVLTTRPPMTAIKLNPC